MPSRTRSVRSSSVAGAATALAALTLASAPAALHHSASRPPVAARVRTSSARAVPASIGHVLSTALATPPSTADCQALFKISCYNPVQYAQAYNLHGVWDKGFTGRGRTIVIVDSYGSPTIQNDLHVFDQTYGLPDVTVQILQPVGPVTFDATDPTQLGWAGETTLDVEYAHAFAPEAKIVLVETPVAETEGVTGFPEIMQAESYVLDHGIGDVISQSFGATEDTFDNPKDLLDLRYAFTKAKSKKVTVLAASGDDGATNATLDGEGTYPYPVNSWPSSDPLVTSIGGTMLHLDAAGDRTSPDETWNDGYGASGGGLSSIFGRPSFQDPVRKIVGDHRGTPDISLSSAVDGAAVIYYSFDPARVGYHLVGGTSEASPIFAGVVAIADQIAGRRLGAIDRSLYALAGQRRSGIVDVTAGNNSFAGVTGYPARRGYDLATGLGTVDVGTFAPALAAQVTGRLGGF